MRAPARRYFLLPDRSLPGAGSVSYVADNKGDERTINGEVKAPTFAEKRNQRLTAGRWQGDRCSGEAAMVRIGWLVRSLCLLV